MKKVASIFILLLSVSAFLQAKALDKKYTDDFYKSLEKSNTQLALDSVLQTFYDFNIRWHPDLAWIRNPYNNPINQYKNFDKQILISSFPQKSEAADYWKNWSKILTAGKFDHKQFFKNEQEMLLMANYNQLILAVHEFGHHLDYLYNINTYASYAGMAAVSLSPLNCTEGFADQIAFVFVSHLAQDKRFAKLRTRYLELINELDRLIPEKNPTSFNGISMVLEGCGNVEYAADMEKFNPIENSEDFRKYVSVYFNRWRIMLTEKEFPSMLDFIETQILQPFFKRIKLNNSPVSVKTVGYFSPSEIEPKDKDGIYLGWEKVLNKNGDARSFIHNFKTQKVEDQFSENWLSGEIEMLNGQNQTIGKTPVTIPKEYQFPFTPAVFALDDDEFYLYLTHNFTIEFEEKTLANCNNILLYRYKRIDGIWDEKLEIINDKELYCGNTRTLISSPDGRLYFLYFKGKNDFSNLDDQTSTDTTGIFLTEVNRETLKLKEPKLYGTFKVTDFPKLSDLLVNAAITNDGRLFVPFENSPTTFSKNGNLAEVKPNGEVTTLVGTVNHYEDGVNKRLIGFTDLYDVRQIDAQTIRVIDLCGKKGDCIREIKLR